MSKERTLKKFIKRLLTLRTEKSSFKHPRILGRWKLNLNPRSNITMDTSLRKCETNTFISGWLCCSITVWIFKDVELITYIQPIYPTFLNFEDWWRENAPCPFLHISHAMQMLMWL
jgi:hypothetical protein